MLYAKELSHTGSIRVVNEDSLVCLRSKKSGIFAVADGMGGHSYGQYASNVATTALYQWWMSHQATLDEAALSTEGVFRSLKLVVDEVNFQLLNYGKLHQTICGTTLSVLVVVDDQYFILHVGDSRIYLKHKDTLSLLTVDDTLSFESYRTGRITYHEYKENEHSSALIKSLGTENRLAYQFYSGSLEQGDVFLLTSDGVHRYFSQDALLDLFKNSNRLNLSKKLRLLSDQIEAFGAVDNYSVIAVC